MIYNKCAMSVQEKRIVFSTRDTEAFACPLVKKQRKLLHLTSHNTHNSKYAIHLNTRDKTFIRKMEVNLYDPGLSKIF